MTERRVRYRGRTVVYDEEEPRLEIDGTDVPVEIEDETADGEGLYFTPIRFYERFTSLGSIAESLIDAEEVEA